MQQVSEFPYPILNLFLECDIHFQKVKIYINQSTAPRMKSTQTIKQLIKQLENLANPLVKHILTNI